MCKTPNTLANLEFQPGLGGIRGSPRWPEAPGAQSPIWPQMWDASQPKSLRGTWGETHVEHSQIWSGLRAHRLTRSQIWLVSRPRGYPRRIPQGPAAQSVELSQIWNGPRARRLIHSQIWLANRPGDALGEAYTGQKTASKS